MGFGGLRRGARTALAILGLLISLIDAQAEQINISGSQGLQWSVGSWGAAGQGAWGLSGVQRVLNGVEVSNTSLFVGLQLNDGGNVCLGDAPLTCFYIPRTTNLTSGMGGVTYSGSTANFPTVNSGNFDNHVSLSMYFDRTRPFVRFDAHIDPLQVTPNVLRFLGSIGPAVGGGPELADLAGTTNFAAYITHSPIPSSQNPLPQDWLLWVFGYSGDFSPFHPFEFQSANTNWDFTGGFDRIWAEFRDGTINNEIGNLVFYLGAFPSEEEARNGLLTLSSLRPGDPLATSFDPDTVINFLHGEALPGRVPEPATIHLVAILLAVFLLGRRKLRGAMEPR